ncbi:ROK family protein [Pseudonocardia sp. DSM 110487]|jgi:predicted NBD/HSP70 family sugar kinase|uniref:ROK family transcriptional regulator n=1 Tax=Pseudonocardia sp. DSM 110487 TaxID=2865833 RepID=UPI001C69A2ED|nr:ROK family transcriptional regulator [Pseudonocardia sp. DSM 110487]QYN33271.1 ROK family protein [Pseudonocardia sp. DSM 110487]
MASDSSVERHANTVSVLTALRVDEGSRLAELAQRTGLSRPTVDSILTELGRLGWVEQREPADAPEGARQAGRPARTYRLDPDAGFVVGVDVGVNLLTAMVADITGTTRHTVTRPISRTTPGAERRTAVQSLVADAVAELGVEPRETLALSLGVPGIVDPAGRVTLSTVIPDWTGFHVEKHFGRWAGVPVTVANDANMATLAEHWIGAARLVDDVVYILSGRRTSAGIIVDGSLHTGRHGAAGEIGSIPELYFSTEELLAMPGSDPDSPDAIGSVFRAAHAGDEQAAALVEELYRRLAQVVDFMVKAFDPDMVVLGGGVSRAGRPLVEGIERHLDRPVFNTTPLVLSQLGPEAVALGAVRSALQLAVRHSPLLAALVAPPLGVPTRPVPGGLQ